MAHSCPECGMTCHCGGDIDDINFGESDQYCSCCDRDDDGEDSDWWVCEFCGTLDDDHMIGCPNNSSPYNELVTRGFD